MIRTEDGMVLAPGDRAFNYYDMKPGRIGRMDLGSEGWFSFLHEDGSYATLDGSRICTIGFAQRKGWLK